MVVTFKEAETIINWSIFFFNFDKFLKFDIETICVIVADI